MMVVDDMKKRPVIGVPAGDPNGIGPEIAVKAVRDGGLHEICRPVVICGSMVLESICRIIGVDPKSSLNRIASPEEGLFEKGIVDYITPSGGDAPNAPNAPSALPEWLEFGSIRAETGKAAYIFIEHAARLAMQGSIDAVATTPISKEALKAAGIEYIGHTEIFAGLTGADDPLTMFQVRGLRIFFLTRHVSLRDAYGLIKKERIAKYIIRCSDALSSLGFGEPHIAVAGLNPHNGEHGLFGREEMDEISPAVEAAKEKGVKVTGPIPADSVFHMALNGRFDAVLSLYHDQGHIASKTLDFERTISLTLGMPFLRTSVDHGTAFDIAGKGIASPVSMIEAIRLAAEYGPAYRKYMRNGKV